MTIRNLWYKLVSETANNLFALLVNVLHGQLDDDHDALVTRIEAQQVAGFVGSIRLLLELFDPESSHPIDKILIDLAPKVTGTLVTVTCGDPYNPRTQAVFARVKQEVESAKAMQNLHAGPDPATPSAAAPVEKKAHRPKNPRHGGFALSPEKRKVIVDEYRQAKNKGEVENMDGWAKMRGITGRTLREYLKEFPEETNGNEIAS